jgi:hypothetical protein
VGEKGSLARLGGRAPIPNKSRGRVGRIKRRMIGLGLTVGIKEVGGATGNGIAGGTMEAACIVVRRGEIQKL